jgi:hypothetical protein
MLAKTRPLRSAIASMVIQTTLISGDSTQIVDDVIDENNFVKVKLMSTILSTTL